METGDSRQNAFSATRFKSGIRFAMAMGTPGDVAERVSFQWTSDNTYAVPDAKGDPYDWTDSPTVSVTAVDIPLSLSVRAAVEFFDAKSSSGSTGMGDFDVGTLKITILDDDWTLVQDVNLGRPDTVIVDGDIYTVDYISPPAGLFTVTIYTVFCSALDES